jgi:hypothetical protein
MTGQLLPFTIVETSPVERLLCVNLQPLTFSKSMFYPSPLRIRVPKTITLPGLAYHGAPR